jgi:hypothetical protein
LRRCAAPDASGCSRCPSAGWPIASSRRFRDWRAAAAKKARSSGDSADCSTAIIHESLPGFVRARLPAHADGGIGYKVADSDELKFSVDAGAGVVIEKNPGLDARTNGAARRARSSTPPSPGIEKNDVAFVTAIATKF